MDQYQDLDLDGIMVDLGQNEDFDILKTFAFIYFDCYF
jgi:hypothetical protein